tara:strand:- start:2348 stop:2704 length:357 start_codon:yes stop_codon:yes gene_type:complete
MKVISKKNIVTLTENALKRIRYLIKIKNDENIVGIKFGLRNRGCNGKSYTLTYLKKNSLDKNDECIVINDIQIGIDKKAILYILGTRIDYTDTLISSEFVFNNPNSKGTCGCGESFNV